MLIVDTQGSVRCLYAESIDLASLGLLCIRRASHVEPDETGQWSVDLSLVGGPKLGPYFRRTEALAAEQQWLETHCLSTQLPLSSSP